MDDESSIPDKCDFCGLRVRYERSGLRRFMPDPIEDDFKKLHRLKKAGIINQVPRRKIGVSIGSNDPEVTAFCSINASAWSNKQQKCEHWTLKVDGATLADHLAIHHSRRGNLLSLGISVLAIVIAILTAIID